jgi:hybrid cluster-associated redox disulfide protein
MAQTLIDKNMTFGEILQQKPQAAQILMRHGLHCIGCHIAVTETLEQGVMAHGLDQKTLQKIVDEINGAKA